MRLPLLTALKVELVIALSDAGITRAELARRLGWHREQVDRLIPYPGIEGKIVFAFASEAMTAGRSLRRH